MATGQAQRRVWSCFSQKLSDTSSWTYQTCHHWTTKRLIGRTPVSIYNLQLSHLWSLKKLFLWPLQSRWNFSEVAKPIYPNSKDLHGILIFCPSVSIRLNHSCSSSVRPHSNTQRSGWILRRAGAPEAPETQDFNDFRNDGVEKQILLPFHGWPHLCTPSEKWWRKTEGRQTCQVKDMQLTTSTCRLEEAQWFFQSDYTLVSLPFHVLSKGKALILICHRIPEKLTCPMKRNNLKRELHLPTIIFRRICSFSAGYLMDPHQHDISNASILRSQFFMIWSAFRSWTTKLSSSILQINTFSVPNFLEGFSFAKSHVLNILNIFNKSSIYHHLLSIYHHCLYV